MVELEDIAEDKNKDMTTWKFSIFVVFVEQLHGEAHLSKIYRNVIRYRLERGLHIGKEPEADIRSNLQANSYGKGDDLFEQVYPGTCIGIWRLKNKEEWRKELDF